MFAVAICQKTPLISLDFDIDLSWDDIVMTIVKYENRPFLYSNRVPELSISELQWNNDSDSSDVKLSLIGVWPKKEEDHRPVGQCAFFHVLQMLHFCHFVIVKYKWKKVIDKKHPCDFHYSNFSAFGTVSRYCYSCKSFQLRIFYIYVIG